MKPLDDSVHHMRLYNFKPRSPEDDLDNLLLMAQGKLFGEGFHVGPLGVVEGITDGSFQLDNKEVYHRRDRIDSYYPLLGQFGAGEHQQYFDAINNRALELCFQYGITTIPKNNYGLGRQAILLKSFSKVIDKNASNLAKHYFTPVKQEKYIIALRKALSVVSLPITL